MLVLMALRTPEMVEIKNEVHVPNSSYICYDMILGFKNNVALSEPRFLHTYITSRNQNLSLIMSCTLQAHFQVPLYFL